MTDPNPYRALTSLGRDDAIPQWPSTKRLWIAYGIAPLVAPLIASITVFVIAFVYQLTHPEDVDMNPMSMILAPALLLVLGIPASYGVAGIVGMPIAFWLRKKGRLNAFTIHGAAFCWAIVLALGIATVAQIANPQGFLALVASSGVLCLVLSPLILLSATAFWIIGARRYPA